MGLSSLAPPAAPSAALPAAPHSFGWNHVYKAPVNWEAPCKPRGDYLIMALE